MIEFKEGQKLTEESLAEAGRFLLDMNTEVEKLNAKFSEFNTSKQNIFDETIIVGSRNLDEAIELVKIKLGSIRLDEKLRGPKR